MKNLRKKTEKGLTIKSNPFFCYAWEQQRLGEICCYCSSNITADVLKNNGHYKLYDANGQIGYTDKTPMKENYFTIIKDGSGVGRVRKLPSNTCFLGTMGAIISKNSSLNFVYYIFEKKDFRNSIIGATIPHIYFSDYSKDLVSVPNKPEQTKIGNLFEKLDSLITLHQRKRKKQLKKE